MQPTRRFIHGFFLHGTTMDLWLFDRSGSYSPGEFNIHKDPKNFICAIAGYAMMSNEELGLDTFIEQNGEDRFITLTEQYDWEGKRTTAGAKSICLNNVQSFAEEQLAAGPVIKKLSSNSHGHGLREANHLNLAQERGVTGLASLLGHHRITSIKELRSGLEFSAAPRFRKGLSSAVISFSPSISKPAQSFRACITKDTPKKRRSTTPDNKQTKRSRSSGQNSSLNQEHETKNMKQRNLSIQARRSLTTVCSDA